MASARRPARLPRRSETRGLLARFRRAAPADGTVVDVLGGGSTSALSATRETAWRRISKRHVDVRDVIQAFNERGFDALNPEWGGTPQEDR
jgi:hypothetical protein